MAHIVVEKDWVGRMIGNTEFDERSVKLNQHERTVLQEAEAICEKAGELQSKINPEDEDCDRNDFAWAAIYLRNCLE